jgi:hypothetical protein
MVSTRAEIDALHGKFRAVNFFAILHINVVQVTIFFNMTTETAKDDIEALKTSENELVTIEEEIAKGLNVSLFVWRAALYLQPTLDSFCGKTKTIFSNIHIPISVADI